MTDAALPGLAPGRTIGEIVEVGRRVFGFRSITEKNAAFVQCLVVLRNVPGPWLTEPKAEVIRRTAREVVRGAK